MKYVLHSRIFCVTLLLHNREEEAQTPFYMRVQGVERLASNPLTHVVVRLRTCLVRLCTFPV